MADLPRYSENKNNRGDFEKVQPNDTQAMYKKKQLQEFEKYQENLDYKREKAINDYRLKLYLSSDNISYEKQRQLEKKFIKFKEQLEEQEKKRMAESAKHIEQELALERKKLREEEQRQQKEWLEGQLELYRETLKDENATFKQKTEAFGKIIKQTYLSNDYVWDKINKSVDNASKTMSQVMDAYSKYQSTINTRLQGSGRTFSNLQGTLLNTVGITPYLKTQSMLDNLQKWVETGIAFNLEQRTFLSSISDKVAATFNAFDSNLLRIVRLQQADSTASRLGMEAYLTKFLNNMFSNTEYLNAAFDTVTGSLVEATSQMSTQMGVQFEYIVQKWLGSLSSVGLSETSVSNIAQAMGYLATGNVSGLESSGMQNLVVMAASRAGLSYADMLTRGINLNETNKLLGSMVEYLQEIGSSTNQVVKNQYASTFGISVSDLRAAANLSATDLKSIGANMLSYSGTLKELNTQLSTVGQRLSLAEKLSNITENAQFSLFSNIADSPGMYALWRITDMIQSYTGGINIPSVLGTGPNTTVENLMKLGIMGVGSLGMIGDIVSGVGNTANFASAFSKLGGAGLITTGRGSGIASSDSGFWESESSYIGQTSGSSFYQQTMANSNQNIQNTITNQAVGNEVNMREDIAMPILRIDQNIDALLTLVRNGISVNVSNYGLSGNTNV